MPDNTSFSRPAFEIFATVLVTISGHSILSYFNRHLKKADYYTEFVRRTPLSLRLTHSSVKFPACKCEEKSLITVLIHPPKKFEQLLSESRENIKFLKKLFFLDSPLLAFPLLSSTKARRFIFSRGVPECFFETRKLMQKFQEKNRIES